VPETDKIVAGLQIDIGYLKDGQVEVRGDIKEIRSDIAKINITTAQIKTLLNGGKKEDGIIADIIPVKWLTWTIVGLVLILATVLGINLPF